MAVVLRAAWTTRSPGGLTRRSLPRCSSWFRPVCESATIEAKLPRHKSFPRLKVSVLGPQRPGPCANEPNSLPVMRTARMKAMPPGGRAVEKSVRSRSRVSLPGAGTVGLGHLLILSQMPHRGYATAAALSVSIDKPQSSSLNEIVSRRRQTRPGPGVGSSCPGQAPGSRLTCWRFCSSGSPA